MGAAVSLLPIWALSSLLSDSVDPMVFDPTVGRAVAIPGIEHRSRSEAWSHSRAGRHGIWGVPDIGALPGPKVAIWGNSHVEGLMLPDGEKIAQQVTALWRSRDTGRLTAYGVGIGGVDIATVYTLLDRYAAVARPTIRHVVIVPDMAFLEPRTRGPLPALRPAPNPTFEAAPAPRPSVPGQTVLAWLHGLRFDFPYRLYEQARQVRTRWRLGRAHANQPPPRDLPAWRATPELTETWSFLLDEMQRRAGSVPVSYLYCPAVPALKQGEVGFEDPQQVAFEHFRMLCSQRGIICRSLASDFIQMFRDHGVFARGFVLHHPYGGHLNRHGDAVIAKAVVTMLEDALHTD